jgi:hypothetical protein
MNLHNQGGVRHPSQHLGEPFSSLVSLLAKDAEERDYLYSILNQRHFPYRELTLPKRVGHRTLHSPEVPLMRLQRRLLRELLYQMAPHPAAFAYRPGLSVIECANVHLDSHTVIRLDEADFFASIRERSVYDVLSSRRWCWSGQPAQRFSRRTAFELAELMTVAPPRPQTWLNRGTGVHVDGDRRIHRSYPYKRHREGFLPQGAPTSGALSNLVLLEADHDIYELATALGLRYTRYSDDLYFSSRHRVIHSAIDRLVAGVRAVIAPLGLHLNDRKMRVARPGSRRTVLGILVDDHRARLPREWHRAIDVHVRGVAQHGLDSHAEHRGFRSTDELTRHVEGLVSWTRAIEPQRGQDQQDSWRRVCSSSATPIQPKPSSQLSSADEARASIDQLLAQGQAHRRSEEYRQLVQFVGRFKKYSQFNAMLVYLQRPGARYVLTERVWQDEYQRTLRPGAQPLVILRPFGPLMVVYDVGDTEPTPGAPRLPRHFIDPLAVESVLTDTHVERLWSTTVDNAARDGIRVTLVDHAAHHAGRTYRGQNTAVSVTRPSKTGTESFPLHWEVEVNRNLAPTDRYATLVHELAHLYCGHQGSPDPRVCPDRRGGPKPRNEVEAESVTFMVMAKLDPGVQMGDYLLGYLDSEGEIPDGVELGLMVHVADEITKMGAKRIPSRVKT